MPDHILKCIHLKKKKNVFVCWSLFPVVQFDNKATWPQGCAGIITVWCFNRWQEIIWLEPKDPTSKSDMLALCVKVFSSWRYLMNLSSPPLGLNYFWLDGISVHQQNKPLLVPARCQSVICTNAILLSIEPLGINFDKIWIKMQQFSSSKINGGVIVTLCVRRGWYTEPQYHNV